MFGNELAGSLHLEGLGEARLGAQEVIQEVVARCQQAGVVKPGDPERFAKSAWATIHGYATLMLDEGSESLCAAGESEDMAQMAADHLLDGLGSSQRG